MNIRLPDKLSLTPLLLERDGRVPRRVAGVIEGDGGSGNDRRHRFVEALEYDGLRCRYRIATPASAASKEPACRVADDETIGYRSFARLIVDRLCTFDRSSAPPLHRLPFAPASRALQRRRERLGARCTLTVIDTCVTPDGRLWVQATWQADLAASHRARPVNDRPHVDGWFVLAEPATVIGAGTRESSRAERDVAA